MKKLLFLTLSAMLFSFASFALGPILGSTSACVGTMGYETDSTSPGGTWSSSNTLIATINPSTGDVYGVSAGTTTITYTLGGSFVTLNYTVYPAPPAAITGNTSFCAGTSSALSDATPGGVWSSSNTYIATVSPAGVVYGVAGGTVYINYSNPSGGPCDASVAVSINTTDAGIIVGATTLCMGTSDTLTDTTSFPIISGTWSSGNPAVATISSSGIVYGVAVGSATISFAVNGTCGIGYATHIINVVNTADPGIISGSSSVNIGASGSLYETVPGGTWSSSNPAIATIDASGVVYGVAAGSVTITYTVFGCGGSADTTFAISVTPIDGISGHVNFGGSGYYGPVKIWLITYNPSTMNLQAVDSYTVYTSSSSLYYQFLGVATDSYRVKAAVYDSAGVTTGYIPTYHTSSFYWYSANVINHTSGTADINKDINMSYGTVTSGPGFISGNVTAGANRGTSTTGIPVAGLNMIVVNSITSQLMQSTRTNASGNYSFSNLPVGSYYVFPDSLNYLTTAYTSITLTTGAATMNAADFIQHTLSKTITPITTAVNNISNIASSVIAFPNPTNGKLNLQWNETTTEKGSVSITDVTGREVYKTVISMNQGTGVKQLDLSGLGNGLYMIAVKSGAVSYNTKIQIQH